MKINSRGYWENETDEGHGVDPKLADAIITFLKTHSVKSVIDLGCGNGYYVKRLNDENIFCIGYDGNPYTRYISVSDLVFVYDLTQKLPLHIRNRPYDWCLSLEVGEHIPQEFEKQFLNNVTSCSLNGIIISWAIPNQGGDGHVNCHTNEYIINEMSKRTFELDLIDTAFLRGRCSSYPETGYWFKNTLMVFKRNV